VSISLAAGIRRQFGHPQFLRNQTATAIAASFAAVAAGSSDLIRSDLWRAAAPETTSTAERATPAIRATASTSSALALPRSGADATPITGPRGAIRNMPTREAPGRTITLSVTEPAPSVSHAGNPPAFGRGAPDPRGWAILRAVHHHRGRHGLNHGSDQHLLDKLGRDDDDDGREVEPAEIDR
jgi:hypothetical protein